MSDDTLFDAEVYGEAKPRRAARRTNVDEHVEPMAPPWLLLANRSGVLGFHVPLHIDEYATAVSLCGLKGHVVTAPEMMVRCKECEALRTNE